LPPRSSTNIKWTENLSFKHFMFSRGIKYIQIKEHLHYQYIV
jgi:hypothetical protein